MSTRSGEARPQPGYQTSQGLKGRVSARLLLLLVVGDILGAGIYVLVGDLAGEVGGLMWLAFAGAFAVALASAASYAELVVRFPGAAGSALYARKAFNSPLVTAMVGIAVLASTASTSATTAKAFAGDYLGAFFSAPSTIVAVGLIGLLSVIAARGIEASARANATLTLIEAAGLIVIITIGISVVMNGNSDATTLVDSGGSGPTALINGLALAFFAFLGFEDAVHLSEEVDEPARVFPRILLLAVLITGTIYLMVAITAAIVVDPSTLAASDGPLLEVVKASPLQVPDRVFAGIALGAVTNTSLFALVAAARLLYGMARDGDLPASLARTSERGSPVVAVAVTGLIAMALAASGSVGPLARTAVTALLSVLFVVNVSAIRTRAAGLDAQAWMPPRWLAWVGAASTGGLFVHQIVTIDRMGLARIGGLVLLGVLGRLLKPGTRSGLGGSEGPTG